MQYEQVSAFAQTWGLCFLVLAFVLAVTYALWPGNREKFKHAALLPLDDGPLDDGPLDDEPQNAGAPSGAQRNH